MPAVQLTRLKTQIARLLQTYTSPADFQRELRSLFESYANWTYRPGRSVPAAPLLPCYHIPPLVLRQLHLSIEPLCLGDAQAGLALADQLWSDSHMEPRQVAGQILGSLPASYSAAVISRVKSWITPSTERLLVQSLLDDASTRLRREDPQKWLEMVKEWSEQKELFYQALAIRALHPLVEDEQFSNLPAVFNLVTPVLQAHANRLQTDLVALIQALGRRTPAETSYYLRQMVGLSQDANIARLVRKSLPVLPANIQAALRAVLSEGSR